MRVLRSCIACDKPLLIDSLATANQSGGLGSGVLHGLVVRWMFARGVTEGRKPGGDVGCMMRNVSANWQGHISTQGHQGR